jgi:hypothetical protein
MEHQMNILIYGNCQTNQLVQGLTLALLGQAGVQGLDVNDPAVKEKLAAVASNQGKNSFDYVVTNHKVSDLIPYFNKDKIIVVPAINFGGFHPDVVYFATRSLPDTPKFFMNNPTVSAIALWTFINKVTINEAEKLYCNGVFEALGYMDYFDVACNAICTNYLEHGIDVSCIERHISSRDVFMYGPLHPKFCVTLSLCFGICDKLGLKPTLSYDNINSVIQDPLQNEYAWGCFPPIAQKLGVPGSWFIRHYGHIFASTSGYLESFNQFMSQFEQQQGLVQMHNRDKEKFDQFHDIDNVLRRFL